MKSICGVLIILTITLLLFLIFSGRLAKAEIVKYEEPCVCKAESIGSIRYFCTNGEVLVWNDGFYAGGLTTLLKASCDCGQDGETFRMWRKEVNGEGENK